MNPVQDVLDITTRLTAKAAPLLANLTVELSGLIEAIADNKTIPPSEVARAYFFVRAAHEALDKSVKALYHVRDRLDKAVVPERLELFGTDITRLPDLGRSFTINEKISASFPDKEAGHAWLREIGQGDLIQETVNAGTLSAFIRNLQIDQNIDPPEGVVKVSAYKTTSINKYTPKIAFSTGAAK
jgi:hypothetical protein